MAKESSFDIVSSVDLQEVDNAYGQSKKEVSQRYDLKDTGSTIEFDKQSKVLTITAPSDFVAGQIVDIVASKLVKRGIDLAAIDWSAPQAASGGNVKRTGAVIEGIDRDKAGAINKDIKAQKFKAKVTIEGDKLRVSSASKDTLQEVIQFVKSQDYGQPLQFVNYR